MKSKEITALAQDLAGKAADLRKHVKGVRFIDLSAVAKMEQAIGDLQHTIIEICEDFDEEDPKGFRKPPAQPRPLYDTREEKAQALEGP